MGGCAVGIDESAAEGNEVRAQKGVPSCTCSPEASKNRAQALCQTSLAKTAAWGSRCSGTASRSSLRRAAVTNTGTPPNADR